MAHREYRRHARRQHHHRGCGAHSRQCGGAGQIDAGEAVRRMGRLAAALLSATTLCAVASCDTPAATVVPVAPKGTSWPVTRPLPVAGSYEAIRIDSLGFTLLGAKLTESGEVIGSMGNADAEGAF